jgi:hypothetical protein
MGLKTIIVMGILAVAVVKIFGCVSSGIRERASSGYKPVEPNLTTETLLKEKVDQQTDFPTGVGKFASLGRQDLVVKSRNIMVVVTTVSRRDQFLADISRLLSTASITASWDLSGLRVSPRADLGVVADAVARAAGESGGVALVLVGYENVDSVFRVGGTVFRRESMIVDRVERTTGTAEEIGLTVRIRPLSIAEVTLAELSYTDRRLVEIDSSGNPVFSETSWEGVVRITTQFCAVFLGGSGSVGHAIVGDRKQQESLTIYAMEVAPTATAVGATP